MTIILALTYEDLIFISFGSHKAGDTGEKDLGEILESYLSRTESGSFRFEKDFFPPVRGRSGSQFYTRSQFTPMEGSGSTAVCPGYISNGTGQSTMLLQKLRMH